MLIACANLAVLFTVRATHRQRETAVRKALGASAGRIVRALAAEALVLGAAATAIGLVVAHLVLRSSGPLLERFLGRTVPGGAAALRIDGMTLVAALAAGLFVVAVCCAAQLWTTGKASLTLALTGGQKGASTEPGQRRAHAALIAVEVAASLTLLVGAALTIQSALRILHVPMGLETRDVVVSRLNLSQQKYPNAASRNAFFDRVVAGAHASGAQQVAFASSWPLQAPPPRDLGRDGDAGFSTRGGVMAVSEEFFATLRIPLDDGRGFDARDGVGAERVAVVSRTLASRLWPGGRAIGQRVRMAPQQGAAANQPPSSFVVIGVAGDVRDNHADIDLGDMYVSFQQYPSPGPFVYVRAGEAIGRIERDLRNVVAAVDADMAIGAPRLLFDILGQQRAAPQFLTTILVIFAVLSALLALVGVYGVIAFTVRQREREIAVRVAIGADRGRIVRLFLGHGARVLGIGILAGMAGAVLLGRVLETQLFNVSAVNPLAIGAVALCFGACGLAAVAWPAFTAAAVDPASALKDS
jgi:putative ABC transport system permease protein